MELKNYNRCLIFLSDFINLDESYITDEFINMYTSYDKDNSYGKLYLVYKYDINKVNRLLFKFKSNKCFYNWLPYTINNTKCIICSFKTEYSKCEQLEFCKKHGRFLNFYNEIKDIISIWKNHLYEFNQILDKEILGIGYNSKLLNMKKGAACESSSLYLFNLHHRHHHQRFYL